MVGQIGPLVQAGRKKTALALHVLGGILGGLTIGVLLGFAGVLLRAAIGDALDTVFLVVVPGALVYTASVALTLLPGVLAWGFDPGLGVTTRIPYQSLLVIPLSAFLVGDMASAVAITTAYGA